MANLPKAVPGLVKNFTVTSEFSVPLMSTTVSVAVPVFSFTRYITGWKPITISVGRGIMEEEVN